MKINNDVLNVLQSSVVDEENYILFLPKVTLDRNLYVAVNKCLESIGGSWNRKLKGHLFDHNPSDDLDEMIVTGEWVDKKKEFQFFRTPKNVVFRMLELAQIKPGQILMEPEAGDGAILEEFPKENPYIAVELMEENCKTLREKGYLVTQGDFLESNFMADIIVMNPPFTRQQDVKHIFHAWECLNKGGTLVSIVSESPFFRENKLSQDFRKWLKDNRATDYQLDSGAFKESGTMIKTRIVRVEKL